MSIENLSGRDDQFPDRISVTRRTAAKLTDTSIDFIDALIASKMLTVSRVGRRVYVHYDSLLSVFGDEDAA